MDQPQVIPFEQALDMEAGPDGSLTFLEILETSRVHMSNLSYSLKSLLDPVIYVITKNPEEPVEITQMIHLAGLAPVEELKVGKIMTLQYPGLFSSYGDGATAATSGLRIEKGGAILILRSGALMSGSPLVTGGVALKEPSKLIL